MENVKDQFLKISGIQDFLTLLNSLADHAPNFSRAEQFTESQLLGLLSDKQHYTTHRIPKKSGGERILKQPSPLLKSVQARLHYLLALVYAPLPIVHGFIKSKSIVTNAQTHLGAKFLYTLDLKDFFPSISAQKVEALLQLAPFNFPISVASFLAKLCCDSEGLPQGAPTSPIVSNIAAYQLDERLVEFANQIGLSYSRYADDLSFSSASPIFTDEIRGKLKKIIESCGFQINCKKERLQTQAQRQIVTGLVVNTKLTVARKYIKTVRAMLHSWQKNGLAECKTVFQERTGKKMGGVRMEKVLLGRIQFIGMVRGKEDSIYQGLLTKFKKLNNIKNAELSLDLLLDCWDELGLDAMLNLLKDK